MSKKNTQASADDLEDGLEYEFSDVGETEPAALVASDDDNDSDGAYYNNESGTMVEPKKSSKKNKKRKLPDGEEQNEGSSQSKKSKKSKNEKRNLRKQEETASYVARKKELALSDPSFIGDYLASKVSHKHKDLSSIELQDMYIPQRWIVSTQDFEKERTLENYTEFMEKYFSKLFKGLSKPTKDGKDSKKSKDSSKSKQPRGSPDDKYVFIIAQSAMRVCEINRCLRSSPGGSIKLIKKNSLDYDRKMFQTGRSRIAVTTCGRLTKLLNIGKNSPKDRIFGINQIAAIVVDSSNLDSKNQHVWDLQDTIPTIKGLMDTINKKENQDEDEEDDEKDQFKYLKLYLY